MELLFQLNLSQRWSFVKLEFCSSASIFVLRYKSLTICRYLDGIPTCDRLVPTYTPVKKYYQ